MTQSTELTVTVNDGEIVTNVENTSVTVFKPQGTDPIINGVKQLIAEFNENPPKLTTASGRAKYKSMAANISKSKVHVEKIGRGLAADIKKQAEDILAQDKQIRDEVIRFCKEMDKLRDEVKAPAVEWEAKDTARKEQHGYAIEALKLLGHGSHHETGVPFTSDELKSRLAQAEAFEITPEKCEEFIEKYTEVLQAVKQNLTKELIPQAVQREEERAELERLRKEQENEAAIRAANERAMREKREAEERAERAEKQRQIDAEQAEKKRLQDIEDAKKAEQDRIRQVQEAEKRQADERAADQSHRKTINRAAHAALMEAGLSHEDALTAITAIVKERVPHVSITY